MNQNRMKSKINQFTLQKLRSWVIYHPCRKPLSIDGSGRRYPKCKSLSYRTGIGMNEEGFDSIRFQMCSSMGRIQLCTSKDSGTSPWCHGAIYGATK
jgi:hypothetical protein